VDYYGDWPRHLHVQYSDQRYVSVGNLPLPKPISSSKAGCQNCVYWRMDSLDIYAHDPYPGGASPAPPGPPGPPPPAPPGPMWRGPRSVLFKDKDGDAAAPPIEIGVVKIFENLPRGGGKHDDPEGLNLYLKTRKKGLTRVFAWPQELILGSGPWSEHRALEVGAPTVSTGTGAMGYQTWTNAMGGGPHPPPGWQPMWQTGDSADFKLDFMDGILAMYHHRLERVFVMVDLVEGYTKTRGNSTYVHKQSTWNDSTYVKTSSTGQWFAYARKQDTRSSLKMRPLHPFDAPRQLRKLKVDKIRMVRDRKGSLALARRKNSAQYNHQYLISCEQQDQRKQCWF